MKLLIFSLLLFTEVTYASICSSTFAGPVATLDGGELKLKNNSSLIHTDNGEIFTSNLTENNGACDGSGCSKKNEDVPSLEYSVNKGDGSDGDLKVNNDTTIDSDKEYKKVEIEENHTLTLQNNIVIKVKDDFKLKKNSTLHIEGNVILYVGGKKFELGDDANITIDPNASLTIFVKDDLKINKNSSIDASGDPTHFRVFAKKIDIQDHDNNSSFEGFLYGKEDVKVGKKTQWLGSIVGGKNKKVEVKENAEITYDTAAANILEIDGICSVLRPVIAYRFDKCSWDGSTGEVTDKQGEHNATDINDTTLTDGIINNAAYFDGDDDYIELPDIDTNFSNGITISVWAKFETVGAYQKIIELSSGTASHVIGFTRNSDSNKLTFELYKKNKDNGDWDDKAYTGITTNDDVIDGQMHHFVATLASDGNARIYVDGIKKASGKFKFMPENATRTKNYIAKSTWDGDGDAYFGGTIDELKIFDSALISSQVKAIYDNESAHKNYDGSHRMAVDCTIPSLLAEYRFDECLYTGATGEVVDSAGGDNNGTITGDANISKTVKKIGHALHLNGGAVDIDNLAVSTDQYKKNTVIFWMYWDGTNNTMPFGWNRYDLWIARNTIGFNTASGDRYGLNIDSLKNGWHHIAAIFTNGDVHSDQLYINGVLQTLTQVSKSPNDTRSYAQSSARIGGWTNNDNYRFNGYLDELKIYQGELNVTQITDIYDSEKDLIRTVTCAQVIFNAVNRANGCFNWDNNITSKIAGDNINLTILSANDEDNSSIADVNITKLELLSFSDASCSTLYNTTEIWSGNQDLNASGCFNPTSFTHNQAVKCAKIKITGLYAGNSVESNSSDTFSIRPKSFILDPLPTGKLTAEESYTFKAKAVNADGTTQTHDYNTSLTPQSHKYFKDGTDGSTMDGTFVPTADFTFSDGSTADTTLSFNNVGKAGLELNDTTWAEVDSDDTPLKNRTIYLEQNLTFIPDRFEIAFDATPMMDNHGRSFTYYANDLASMSADLKNLSFKVTALGKNGATMSNYHDDTKYYANDVDFSLGLSLEQNPSQSSDINETNVIKSINFDHGIASLSYANIHFNFGRERNVTKEPLTLDGVNSDINITVIDNIDSEVNGTKTQNFDGNATFYYGRIRTKDIKTNQISVDTDIKVQIYSSSTLAGFEQESLSWYLNKLDDFTVIGERDEEDRKLTDTTVNNNTISNGTQSFTITANPTDKSYKKFYHLKIPIWLWYSHYEDYDFTTPGSCASHPCFGYIFDTATDDRDIKSGDFKGAAFSNEFNSTQKRKGLKVLR